MAGLYGDLPQAVNTTAETTAWGAVPKMQPQLRKPAPLAPPPSLLRAGRGGGRTPSGGRGAGRGAGAAGDSSAAGEAGGQGSTAVAAPLTSTSAAAASIFASVKDEYDPMRPNDYEQVLKERERAKREAEAEAERVAKVKEMEAHMERLRRQEDGPGSNPYEDARQRSLNISGEEAFARRGQMGGPGGLGLGSTGGAPDYDAGPSTAGLGSSNNNNSGQGAAGGEAKGMSLAKKLLMKMGWEEGEGLGRERQGMSTPLVMQKTAARTGVIVNAEPTGPAAEKRQRTGATLVGQPSRVLCLRNMIGPGEVDEELEEEVGQECSKYGAVTSVMIFEVTQPGFPGEEAVRIFVQFERVESATKAQIDLQGRFFGGRNVRVAFFPEDRFDRTDLAPKAGEFD